MRSVLWPHCTSEHHITDLHLYFSEGGALATFVAADLEGRLCGFVEASLRPSAEGCTTKPVGYLEGIFVEPGFRRRGVGRLLVEEVRRWASAHGCTEFASDCRADNAASIHFHRRLGFAVAAELVHFRQAIASDANAGVG